MEAPRYGVFSVEGAAMFSPESPLDADAQLETGDRVAPRYIALALELVTSN